MFVKQLIYLIYIISIQIVYSYKLYTYENITNYVENYDNEELEVYKKYIKVYDKNQILNKSKVLKIRNDFFSQLLL